MTITAAGFPGTVTEVEFATMMSGLANYGIIGGYLDNSFAASRVVGSRTVNVQPGVAWAPGVLVEMDAVAQPAAAPNNATGSTRIDLLVMRVNWTTHAAALAIITGGSATIPPSFNSVPGTVFDVPLCELPLAPGASDYSTANIANGDRRVWLIDGMMVQGSERQAPPLVSGRMLYNPNEGRLAIGGQSQYFYHSADRDSGWVDAGFATPGGFGGSVKVRLLNQLCCLQFNWTKVGGTSANGAEFDRVIPVGLQSGGIQISTVLLAHNTPFPVAVDETNIHFGPMPPIATGQQLRGYLSYPNQIV